MQAEGLIRTEVRLGCGCSRGWCENTTFIAQTNRFTGRSTSTKVWKMAGFMTWQLEKAQLLETRLESHSCTPSADCLRSMLIHQETIKESLEADPPCSPDSWQINACTCVYITSLLPVNLLPSYKIHVLLFSYCHCWSRVWSLMESPPCTCGSLIAGSGSKAQIDLIHRCCRAGTPNQGYLKSSGYFCGL